MLHTAKRFKKKEKNKSALKEFGVVLFLAWEGRLLWKLCFLQKVALLAELVTKSSSSELKLETKTNV